MNTSTPNWADNKRRKTLELFYWTLAWLLTYALATFGPKLFWQSEALSIAAIAANATIGIGVLLANTRHLRSIDEMERKVSLDAMAITLGVGFIAGFSYTLLEAAELIAFKVEPYHLLSGMALVLIASMLFGVRRLQ